MVPWAQPLRVNLFLRVESEQESLFFKTNLVLTTTVKKKKKTNINLFFQLQFQKTHRTTVYNYQDVQDK